MKDSASIPKEAIDVSIRFFEAVDFLTSSRRIKGIATLAKQWGVDRSVLSVMKNHPEEKRIKMEYPLFLSRDYGISAEWLFFGEGTMMK